MNPRVLAYAMWLAASIFYSYQYVLRVLPNIILSDVIQRFDIDTIVFGQFSGIYYLGYVLMHLPLGIMLDRYGPRKIMSICIFLSAISILPIISSDNPLYLIAGRALLGISSSAAILGIFKVIRLGFNEKYFTRMLSLSVTIGLIGAIYGGGPLSYLYANLGYEPVVKILTTIGIILAIITYLAVPEIEVVRTDNNIFANVGEVLTNYRVMLLACFAGLMVGPLEGFADVWGVEYLKQLYNMEVITASYVSSMIFIGMCFGAPLLSLIAEKTGYYVGTIIAAGFIMFAVFTTLLLGLLNIYGIISSFILVGICCGYQIIVIYKTSTFVREEISGLTTAVTNMLIMSFGYGFHTLIGIVVNSYKDTSPEIALTYGISIIPIALFIGGVGIIICFRQNLREF